MTGCADARALLLTAEPEELAGEGQGPLAEHLRQCADCRRTADRLLGAQRGLAAVLERRETRLDPDQTARRALIAGRGTGRALSWRRAVRWVPLAAAAVVALVLLTREAPFPAEPPAEEASAAPSLEVDVRPVGTRTAAVFRTDDPNILVVWFF